MSADLVEQVQSLGSDFWSWRSAQQPRSRDDIPRLERSVNWLPDWTRAAVARYLERIDAFEHAHRAVDVSGATIPLQVDHALLGSAIARVRFELETVASWRHQPSFYVDQTLGVVFDLLVENRPWDEGRAREVLHALGAVPAGLLIARENLAGEAVEPFAKVTVDELGSIEAQLAALADALVAVFPPGLHRSVVEQASNAGRALASYREWLEGGAGGLREWKPIGEEGLSRFLHDVALVPYSPCELLELARVEHARAVALSAAEATREPPPPRPLGDLERLVRRATEEEAATRTFYEERGILSQPSTLRHYLMAPMPAYLTPLSWLGVTDDLTSESRVEEDATRYLPPVTEDLPYFFAANARDPRCLIAHEGVHYQQLALSWRHPNPIRRRYYDSCSNEGIAFYNEEMMLQAGYFSETSATRGTICSFMRLRALRVEVDVRLATGDMTLDEARDFLVVTVPMDVATATEEAALFASTPGQGLSYQVGKSQIQRLLADAARVQGRDFDLKRFHDSLWQNGNVPIALQRLELLGGGLAGVSGLSR
ncbi:MAG: DUF885 family protein [Actinomycetota bacterium]|nr:DUF885 family protein [Actinomycetota bacterium]